MSVANLGIFLTGGATNADPDASLGGVASSFVQRGLGFVLSNPIPALRIDNAWPASGEGIGTLAVNGAGEVVYTPPGGSPGTPVAIAAGASEVVTGDEPGEQALLIYRESGLSLIPPSPQTPSTLKFVNIVRGAIGGRNVDDSERSSGLTTYRALMLESSGTVDNVLIWFPPSSTQATYSVGVETSVAGAIQTIANETTAPTGITWYTPTTMGGALTISSIGGTPIGLWIRRVFPSSGHVASLEQVEMVIQFSESSSTTYTETYTHGYRVADAADALYELYVGVNSPPDFTGSGQPVATSATLPFDWTPTLPSSGTATLYCVVRYRNKYDLESFNVYSTQLVFVAHVAKLSTITPPLTPVVYNGGSTCIRVISKYYDLDDSNPADTWRVYIGIGVDPVPGESAYPPVYDEPMVFIGGETGLAATICSSSHAPGDTLHVLVVAYRSADDGMADAGIVEYTMPASLDLVDGYLFGGSTFEHR